MINIQSGCVLAIDGQLFIVHRLGAWRCRHNPIVQWLAKQTEATSDAVADLAGRLLEIAADEILTDNPGLHLQPIREIPVNKVVIPVNLGSRVIFSKQIYTIKHDPVRAVKGI